jgi:cyclopropane fatty-acyl-phospholipid synthase-like methyltransferase
MFSKGARRADEFGSLFEPAAEHPYILGQLKQVSIYTVSARPTRASLEKHGLAVLDVENIVRHYSYTVLGWLRRCREKRSTLNPARYDRIFQRMWEYYLSCGIAAARASDAAVYQVLFHDDRAGDIPLKRV